MITFDHSCTRTRTMSAFVQPTAVFPPTQPDDPNSPVLFKDNISLVQTQITTVRSLAHEALNAMYVIVLHCLTPPFFFSKIFIISKGAYQPGSNPAHTAGTFVLSPPLLLSAPILRWRYSQTIWPR